ncbi:hypothetical protein C8R44DRAFT_809639, partial [Mycena epipterygia]
MCTLRLRSLLTLYVSIPLLLWYHPSSILPFFHARLLPTPSHLLFLPTHHPSRPPVPSSPLLHSFIPHSTRAHSQPPLRFHLPIHPYIPGLPLLD